MSNEHTICQNCIFAEFDDTTQVGCQAGMIDSAIKSGIKVVECWNELGEFYLIPTRKCMMKRDKNKNWVSKHYGQENLEEIAFNEVKIKFTSIVVCDKKTTLEDLKITVDSLERQLLKPDFLVIINGSDIDRLDIFNYCKTKSFNEWKIENLVPDIQPNRLSVELILKFKPRPFFATFRAGKEIHEKFFSDLNYKIIKEWFVFSIISNPNDEVHGVVVPHIIYEYFKNFSHLEQYIERANAECPGIYKIQEIDKNFH